MRVHPQVGGAVWEGPVGHLPAEKQARCRGEHLLCQFPHLWHCKESELVIFEPWNYLCSRIVVYQVKALQRPRHPGRCGGHPKVAVAGGRTAWRLTEKVNEPPVGAYQPSADVLPRQQPTEPSRPLVTQLLYGHRLEPVLSVQWCCACPRPREGPLKIRPARPTVLPLRRPGADTEPSQRALIGSEENKATEADQVHLGAWFEVLARAFVQGYYVLVRVRPSKFNGGARGTQLPPGVCYSAERRQSPGAAHPPVLQPLQRRNPPEFPPPFLHRHCPAPLQSQWPKLLWEISHLSLRPFDAAGAIKYRN
eukprot:Hpha_TRINITY_DN14869_c1_g2::TRINITY_DN14869_c1_g2_i1::g.169547::m.169547